MDETSVWNDMVSNTTIDKHGVKSVCLKTTGYEKCMVSVYLAAKADGTKLKLLIVFHAAKRDSKSFDEEFKTRCVVKSNAWINEELTNYHLGKTSFRCLFIQQAIFSLGLLRIPYDRQHKKRSEGNECR